MKHILFLALTLTVLWLAISGVYKPVIFMLGVGSLVLVIWVASRMRIIGEEHNPLVFSWRLPVFWLWALREIVLANLHVARLVFKPQEISPRIVKVPVPLQSELGRVVYGNTCTLTPGTVTLTLDNEKLVAHALDQHSAEALLSGRLVRKIQWLEGSKGPTP
ncbi:MAG: Na+/H+ antiporter subunit E [Wenzhouxiangella sp.]|jgi:multicomponent Na+:H+ antiporter subunit E|nr:Na+/H+ antiporter subunit E [Wenzhouxiangella sp.]